MAWNQTSADPMMKLNRKVKGWEAKGINYWEARLAQYDAKVRASDNSATLKRMLEQQDMAKIAVYALSKAAFKERL